jgi:catechol-2,3-dioxygenase
LAGDNGQLLELIPDQSENQVPNKDKRFHLAIKVNDFNEALAKLRAEKVETETSFDIFRGGKVVFFQDPEGNWLHLIFRPENPWKNC